MYPLGTLKEFFAFLASLAMYRQRSICNIDLVIGFGEMEASSSLLISLRLKDPSFVSF
jgi:hypothetical protein